MIDIKTTRNFSYGLFVLTANDGKDNGCIINTAIQVTSEPYKISIAVNKNNYTLSQILNTRVFNISLLSQDCPFEIFTRFGFQSGKTVDKFADFPSPVSANGLKYISAKYANAFISCKVENALDLGTHMLLVGEVTEAKILSSVPSMTYSYYFENVKPKPQAVASDKAVYSCQLCGYKYDENKESTPFNNLSNDWACPMCGMSKSEFKADKPTAPSTPKKKVWVCTICGYVYDDNKEKIPFEELPSDWTCPLCKHPKSDFELQK